MSYPVLATVLAAAAQPANEPTDSGISAELAVLLALLAGTGVVIAAVVTTRATAAQQKRELSHDRHMRDLQELRAVLDVAAEALESVLIGLRDLHLHVVNTEAVDDPEVMRLQRLYANALRGAVVQQDRIAMRLGRDNDVFTAYSQAVAWISQAAKTVTRSDEPKADVNEVITRLDRFSEYRRSFTEAAQARIGAALAEPRDES